jgi:hemolysin activation/secretion protein
MFEWIGIVQLTFPMPLGSLFFENEWGVLENESLKRNNFYRLGGVKSIRGFNEKSIYAKAYNYAKFEYRLFLSSESFAYLLYDIGYFNEPVNTGLYAIWRQAIGLGLNINTAAGQLSISYAFGKYGTESIHVNQGKIHMGYINRF